MFEPVPKPVRVNLGFLGIPIRSSNWNLLPDFVRPKPLGGDGHIIYPLPLEGWDILKSITFTIPKGTVSTDLINFPLQLRITPSSGSNSYDCSEYLNYMKSAGPRRIAIENVATREECYAELDYSSSNYQTLFTLVPRIYSNKDTVLRLYYDKDHADNPLIEYTNKPVVEMAINAISEHYGAVTELTYHSILYDEGLYKIWLSVRDSDTYYHVAYGESVDGVNWNKLRICLLRGASGHPSDIHSVVPTVIRLSNGMYRMWYAGYNGSIVNPFITCISSDGINWYNFEVCMFLGAQGTYDATNMHKISVIQESPTLYKMWYGASGTNWRILYAESEDGVHWTNHQLVMNINNGSYDVNGCITPWVIKESYNSYKMWYSAHDSSRWQIAYCTSPNGIQWYQHQLVIKTGSRGYLEAVNCLGVSVIKISNNSYKLWYTAYNVSTGNNIICTDSVDGISWNNTSLAVDNALVAYDSSYIAYPFILKESDTSYKMWYEVNNGTNGWIAYCTSKDGDNWENHRIAFDIKQTIYSSAGNEKPIVIKESDTLYKMWYGGSEGTNKRILYCESADCINWTNHQLSLNINSTLDKYDSVHCTHHFVLKDLGLYKVWYSGYNGTNYRIIYAESMDGVNWSNFQLSVDINFLGTYDTNYAFRPYVAKEGSTYIMWYCCSDGTNYRTIRTISTDGIHWTSPRLCIDKNHNKIYDTVNNYIGTVIKESNYYRFYSAVKESATPTRILQTRSLTGVTAGDTVHLFSTGRQGVYDTSAIYNPFVLKESDTVYKMWYSASNGTNYRILLCTSTNGIDWTIPVLNLNIGAQGTYDTVHVLQPCVVKEPSGYKMWYCAYNGTTYRTVSCTSSDGINWVNFQLAVNVNSQGVYDTANIYSPYIIKETGGYKMWYGGNDGTTTRLLYCESVDSITWTNFQLAIDKNASVWDTNGPYEPCVVKETVGYRIWYSGADGTSTYRTITAVSTNGINWTGHTLSLDKGVITQDTNHAYHAHVIKDGEFYKFWYVGLNGPHFIYHISPTPLRTSKPLLSIDRNVTAYNSIGNLSVTVLKEDTLYKMWYSGWNNTNIQILYCTSTDGINWSNHQLSLNIGAQGTYDTNYVYGPCIIKDGSTYRMWYSGWDNTNYRILYCTSLDGITWSNFQLSVNISSQGTYDTTRVLSPCIIKESDNFYRMWYTGYNGTNFRILYCESTDGITWTNFQLAININAFGTYDTSRAMYAKVVKENNIYRMYYVVHDGSYDRIAYCTSLNGKNWSNHQLLINIGAQGTYDSTGIDSIDIIKEVGFYRIWYTGKDGTYRRTLYFESKYGGSPSSSLIDVNYNVLKAYRAYTSFNGAYTCVIKESPTSYKMWMCQADASNNYRIFICVSSNGVNWSKPSLCIDLASQGFQDTTGVATPCVIKESDTLYKMWYLGNNTYHIYCTSSDGYIWKDFKLCLSPNNIPAYDVNAVSTHCIIKESDTSYKKWYRGVNGTTGRIIYCESSDGITWTNFQLAVDLNIEKTYDTSNLDSPSVIKEDGLYRMWYVGKNATTSAIISCVSADGITWTKHEVVLHNNMHSMLLDATIDTVHVIKDDDIYRIFYSGKEGTNYRVFQYTTPIGRCTNPPAAIKRTAGANDTDQASCFVLKESDSSYKMWYTGYAGSVWQIFLSTSTNGINWNPGQLVISSTAGYHLMGISVIKENSTSYKMWYTKWDGTYYGILYCVSTDGITWTGHQTVITRGSNKWNAHSSRDPVVRKEDGLYKMWYGGSNTDTYPLNILYSTSVDGVNWTTSILSIRKGSQGAYDTGYMGASCIIKEGNLYRMWYTCYNGSVWNVVTCISEDGINWRDFKLALDAKALTTLDNTYQGYMFVLPENGYYRVWYSGYTSAWRMIYYSSPYVSDFKHYRNAIALWKPTQLDTQTYHPKILLISPGLFRCWYSVYDGTNYRIYTALSEDGVSWYDKRLSVDFGDIPTYATTHAYQPWVIMESPSSYKMWYSGQDGTYERIIYCTSTNGINWTNHQLSVNRGSQGTYDSNSARYCCVIKESDTSYKMWYSGYDGTNHRIIYCTSTNGITWTNFQLSMNIGVQGTYDTRFAYSPFVIKESNTVYKMWYTGQTMTNARTLYCTSTDGITWTSPQLSINIGTQGTWDTVHAYCPCLYQISSNPLIYRVWYSASEGTTTRCLTGLMIDGKLQTPAKKVWDDNYLGVYHFSQSTAGGKLWDSTLRGNHLTSYGTNATWTLVKDSVGPGVFLNGSTDYLERLNFINLGINNLFCTVETYATGRYVLISTERSISNSTGCTWSVGHTLVYGRVDQDIPPYVSYVRNLKSEPSFTKYAAFVSNGAANPRLLYNHGLTHYETLNFTYTEQATSNINIGRWRNYTWSNERSSFINHEIRFSNLARSEDWVRLTHLNLVDKSHSISTYSDIWIQTLYANISSWSVRGTHTNFPLKMTLGRYSGTNSYDTTYLGSVLGGNDENTQLLIQTHENKIQDYSSKNHVITNNGTVYSSTQYKLHSKSLNGGSLTIVRNTGDDTILYPSHHWIFANSGNLPYESRSSSAIGTIVGAAYSTTNPRFADGFLDQCATSVSRGGLYIAGGISFKSVSIWAKRNTTYTNDVCHIAHAVGSDMFYRNLCINRDSGSNYVMLNNIYTSFQIRNDSWHHFVLVEAQDSNNHLLYVDGVADSTVRTTNFGGLLEVFGYQGSASTAHRSAATDNIQVYQEKLTAAQVSRLYNVGASSTDQLTFASARVYDLVDWDKDNGTIDFLIYLPSVSADMTFIQGSAAGDIKIGYNNGLAIGRRDVGWDSTLAFTLQPNVWYHLVYSKCNSNFLAFMNTANVGVVANTISYNCNNLEILIGDNYIDEVRVSNSTRFTGNYITRNIKYNKTYEHLFITDESDKSLSTEVEYIKIGPAKETAVFISGGLAADSTLFIDKTDPSRSITSAGAKHSRIICGTSLYNDLYHGNSILIDSYTKYLSIGNTSNLNFAQGPWTIRFWFFNIPTSWSGYTYIISQNSGTSPFPGWYLATNNNTGNLYFTSNNNSTTALCAAADTLTTNRWHYITASFDGGHNGTSNTGLIRIFIDGDKKLEASMTMQHAAYDITVGRLGTAYTSGVCNAGFDDIEIILGYTQKTDFTPPTRRNDGQQLNAVLNVQVPSLSSTKTTQLKIKVDPTKINPKIGPIGSTIAKTVWSDYRMVYHMAQIPLEANAIKDSTANESHGTPVGMLYSQVKTNISGPYLYMDGVDDVINIPNVAATPNWTFGALLYQVSAAANGDGIIVADGDGLVYAGSRLCVLDNNAVTKKGTLLSNITGRWVFIVGTSDGKFYEDGKEVGVSLTDTGWGLTGVTSIGSGKSAGKPEINLSFVYKSDNIQSADYIYTMNQSLRDNLITYSRG